MKRPTVEELREAWLRWPQHNPQSEHGLEHAFGVAWRDCVPCAIWAALDLLAEAQRDTATLEWWLASTGCSRNYIEEQAGTAARDGEEGGK